MRSGRCCVREVVAAAALAPICWLAAPAAASGQQFGTIFRGDEIGPSQLEFDEETFLNVLSFEQPLESVQPFLAADNGWQVALGSLTADVLWYEQDVKYRAPIDDTLAARLSMHNGLDLDDDYTQIQVMPELEFADHWYAAIPVVLATDKGAIDGGLSLTYREPARGIDFVQAQWVRSDLVFNDRSNEFKDSEVLRPADNFELQAQAELFGFGKTTVILADEVPSKVNFVETERIDEFSRFTARVLQACEWEPTQRCFLDARYEIANESSTPTGPLGASDAFDGDRDYFSVRAEYQRDVDAEKVRRWRGGAQYLYFRENEQQPADPKLDHTELRREAMIYAGYRSPLGDSKNVDLETVVYLDRLDSSRRYPNDPKQTESDPAFQGKLSFYFRWHVVDRAEFVLSPSFELDEIGWGGGSVALRYRL